MDRRDGGELTRLQKLLTLIGNEPLAPASNGVLDLTRRRSDIERAADILQELYDTEALQRAKLLEVRQNGSALSTAVRRTIEARLAKDAVPTSSGTDEV